MTIQSSKLGTFSRRRSQCLCYQIIIVQKEIAKSFSSRPRTRENCLDQISKAKQRRKAWEVFERWSSATEEILKIFWKNPERIMKRFWKDSEKILKKSWKDYEKILKRFWKDSEKILRRTKMELPKRFYLALVLMLFTCSVTEARTQQIHDESLKMSDVHHHRVKRMFGYRTKCLPEKKKFCWTFSYKGMKRVFCIYAKVKNCTGLDIADSISKTAWHSGLAKLAQR